MAYIHRRRLLRLAVVPAVLVLALTGSTGAPAGVSASGEGDFVMKISMMSTVQSITNSGPGRAVTTFGVTVSE